MRTDVHDPSGRPSPRSNTGLGRARFLGILAAALVVLAGVAATPTRAEGVRWEDLSISEALAKAQEQDAMVLVDVYAAHCHQCQVMDEELWDTPAGAELAEGMVAVRYPSDKPAGIEVLRRYPVLGLPLVLFLKPDGTELDRIVSYHERDAWLAEARLLKAGADPLPQLLEELEANPERAEIAYAVFEKYLYRKRVSDAEAMLEHLIKLDPQHTGTYAARALSLLAKFYDYFAYDMDRAQFLHRTIVEQYPNTGFVTSALKETFEFHQKQGTLDAWKTWVCPIALANPQARYLNRYAATFGLRGGLSDPCLAQAARNASALERYPKQKTYLDSIAVVLEGGGR